MRLEQIFIPMSNYEMMLLLSSQAPCSSHDDDVRYDGEHERLRVVRLVVYVTERFSIVCIRRTRVWLSLTVSAFSPPSQPHSHLISSSRPFIAPDVHCHNHITVVVQTHSDATVE